MAKQRTKGFFSVPNSVLYENAFEPLEFSTMLALVERALDEGKDTMPPNVRNVYLSIRNKLNNFIYNTPSQ